MYFLRNNTPNANVNGWEFTGYKYTHPKIVEDKVKLKYVVRGSNQKFMIIGDGSKWYWTYGNNTFNPAKHQLNLLPTYVKGSNYPNISNVKNSYIITSSYPNKIYVLTIITGNDCWDNPYWKSIGYSDVGGDGFEPKTDFMGWEMWELDVSTSTWKTVKFNYYQAGNTNKLISSTCYIPFLYKLVKGYPRKDRTDFSQTWSLVEARFKYTYGITYWFEQWLHYPANKYDRDLKRIALKYFTTGYGGDDRNGLFVSGTNSFGISLENFTITGANEVSCTVVNGKAMNSLETIDTVNVGATPNNNPFADSLGSGWTGQKTFTMITEGVIYSYGSAAWGGFPAEIHKSDLRLKQQWLNYDSFYNDPFDHTNVNSVTLYNEVNPIGLSIGMHSDFYLLPTNAPNEYGCISVVNYPGSKSNLIYRRTGAITNQKDKISPTNNYTIFGNLTEGYPLSGDVRMVIEDFYLPFTTVVLNVNSARKDQYLKHILSHSTYNRNSNQTTVNNTTANHLYYEEISFNMNNLITMNIDKTVNLENIVKTKIGPKLKEYVDANCPTINILNYIATYCVVPVNIESLTYNNLLLFITNGIGPDGSIKCFAIAFYITSYTANGNGVFTANDVAYVGNWVNFNQSKIKEDFVQSYLTENKEIPLARSTNNLAPRNITIQQKDGNSVVIYSASHIYDVTGDNYRPGGIFNVHPINGIVGSEEYSNYWAVGGVRYISHPYYGIGGRYQPIGAAEVALIYADNGTNNYENIRTRVSTGKYFLGMNNYIEFAYTVYFKSSENIIVGGNEYTLPSGRIDLYDVDTSLANKTFYCYLVYGINGPEYKILTSAIAETYSQALIATIITNSTGIYQIIRQNVFTMNGFRINSTRHGSTIPQATGSIEVWGQTTGWADNPGDLS